MGAGLDMALQARRTRVERERALEPEDLPARRGAPDARPPLAREPQERDDFVIARRSAAAGDRDPRARAKERPAPSLRALDAGDSASWAQAQVLPGAAWSGAPASSDADPAMLSRLTGALEKDFPKSPYWELTRGNQLPAGWLQLTPIDLSDCSGGDCKALSYKPNPDGRPVPKIRSGHSDGLYQDFHDAILKAKSSITYTGLGEPNGQYMSKMREALEEVAKQDRHGAPPLEVRLLIGREQKGGRDVRLENVVQELTKNFPPEAKDRIHITVGSYGGAPFDTWNHSKILAVDGKYVMSGGITFNAPDYHGDGPVFDASMRVAGPAAKSAEKYAGALWGAKCDTWAEWPAGQKPHGWFGQERDPLQPGAGQCPWREVPAGSPVGAAPNPRFGVGAQVDDVTVLSVGAPGSIPPEVPVVGNLHPYAVEPGPSDRAIHTMIDAAQSRVLISQQELISRDLAGDTSDPTYKKYAPNQHFSAPLLDRLGAAVARGVAVDVVITAPDVSRDGYWHGQQLDATHAAIAGRARAQARTPEERAKVEKYIQEKLRVSPLLARGQGVTNHAKVVVADDAFYVGSQNLYPGGMYDRTITQLAEHGFIVVSKRATAELLRNYHPWPRG